MKFHRSLTECSAILHQYFYFYGFFMPKDYMHWTKIWFLQIMLQILGLHWIHTLGVIKKLSRKASKVIIPLLFSKNCSRFQDKGGKHRDLSWLNSLVTETGIRSSLMGHWVASHTDFCTFMYSLDSCWNDIIKMW